eukprot:TRINITY_DN1606_c0_g1_i11.p1 TRINITY_DN1606_c0_g1~~TRINITY_DN1606_c0_g1_i11.p1  ORF type:complete len:1418 (+),score=257.80 TRINITY_DN1606_c0_g1_i11:480-4733(+)
MGYYYSSFVVTISVILLLQSTGTLANIPITDCDIGSTLWSDSCYLRAGNYTFSGLTIDAHILVIGYPVTINAAYLTIAGNGWLDADGQGYNTTTLLSNGTGPGAGVLVSYGGNYYTSGASHAGTGGNLNSLNITSGQVYGSVFNANTPGSSGASSVSQVGGSGGGVIIINVSIMFAVTGRISADAPTMSNCQGASAGSGGSITIKTSYWSIIPNSISANGGSCLGGTGVGGSGGRIYFWIIYNPPLEVFELGFAHGGDGNDNNPLSKGAAGTVMYDNTVGNLVLIVENNFLPPQPKPTPPENLYNSFIPREISSGMNEPGVTYINEDVTLFSLNMQGGAMLAVGGYLTVQRGIYSTDSPQFLISTIYVLSGKTLDIHECHGGRRQYIVPKINAHISVNGGYLVLPEETYLLGVTLIVQENSILASFYPFSYGDTSTVSLELHTGTLLRFSSLANSFGRGQGEYFFNSINMREDSVIEQTDYLQPIFGGYLGQTIVDYSFNTFLLYCINEVELYDLSVMFVSSLRMYTNDLNMEVTARIDADGRGYPARLAQGDGFGPGAGKFDHINFVCGGAGHGGNGGSPFNRPSDTVGLAYGSTFYPLEPGSSGCSTGAQRGGNGGGVIYININTTMSFMLSGTITARGTANDNGCSGAGAGSGGSIFFDFASSLGASWSPDYSWVEASGGSCSSGGSAGAGGRISYLENTGLTETPGGGSSPPPASKRAKKGKTKETYAEVDKYFKQNREEQKREESDEGHRRNKRSMDTNGIAQGFFAYGGVSSDGGSFNGGPGSIASLDLLYLLSGVLVDNNWVRSSWSNDFSDTVFPPRYPNAAYITEELSFLNYVGITGGARLIFDPLNSNITIQHFDGFGTGDLYINDHQTVYLLGFKGYPCPSYILQTSFYVPEYAALHFGESICNTFYYTGNMYVAGYLDMPQNEVFFQGSNVIFEPTSALNGFPGQYYFDGELQVTQGATLSFLSPCGFGSEIQVPWGLTVELSSVIYVLSASITGSSTLSVDRTSRIVASSVSDDTQAYGTGNYVPGGSGRNSTNTGGGCGGTGGSPRGVGAAGKTYDLGTWLCGSPGKGGQNARGGGFLYLDFSEIEVDGIISVDGEDGFNGGSGGSGGAISLFTSNLIGIGSFTANGGDGSANATIHAGGGGGGQIFTYFYIGTKRRVVSGDYYSNIFEAYGGQGDCGHLLCNGGAGPIYFEFASGETYLLLSNRFDKTGFSIHNAPVSLDFSPEDEGGVSFFWGGYESYVSQLEINNGVYLFFGPPSFSLILEEDILGDSTGSVVIQSGQSFQFNSSELYPTYEGEYVSLMPINVFVLQGGEAFLKGNVSLTNTIFYYHSEADVYFSDVNIFLYEGAELQLYSANKSAVRTFYFNGVQAFPFSLIFGNNTAIQSTNTIICPYSALIPLLRLC